MKEKGQYLKGLIGEKKAEKLLKREGYRVLARRFRAAGGEIDLICRDGNMIVFVEVKYRPEGNRGDGIMAVTPDKVRRITGAGQVYLMRCPDAPARIDLVEITRDGADHIRNIY